MPATSILCVAQLGPGDIAAWVSVVIAVGGGIFGFVYQFLKDRKPVLVRTAPPEPQASKVFAWWSIQPPSALGGKPVCEAVVDNASPAPVFYANVTVRHVHHGWTEKHSWPTVPPATRFSVPVQGGRRGAGHPKPGDHQVRLLFKDESNGFWLREEGNLRELEPELLIWAERRRAEALGRQLERDFAGLYGITLGFDTGRVEELLGRFDDVGGPASHGTCPDLLLGPHDWLGRLAGRGIFEPIVLTPPQRASFAADALAAMTFGDQLYGVPSVYDTVALIRNTDLAPDPPTSIEELIAHGRRLRDAQPVPEDFTVLALQVGAGGDPYHAWPLLSSAGAQLFGRHPDGSWDASKLLIGEMAPALARLRALGDRGAKILRADLDRDAAVRLFLDRRTPYLIAASRALGDIEAENRTRPAEQRLRFAVSAVPGFADGGPAVPFVSVYGFYVPRRAKNKALALDLVGDYLARADVGAGLAAAQYRPPAQVGVPAASVTANSVGVYAQECRRGILMPPFPFMKEVWAAVGEAERKAITGADPDRLAGALRRTVARHTGTK